MSREPDWPLIRLITRTAADPQWCGGIHREDLAELAGLPSWSDALGTAIAIAARLGRIDLCGQYVVPATRRAPRAKRRTD